MASLGEMSSEVSDLNGRGSGSKVLGGAKTRKEQIEAELKLIEWHKMANEAAIKSALLQNKNIKTEAVPKKPSFTSDDSRWMRKVIDDEHNKPLEVSKNFIIELERREIEKQEHMAKQVESHIHTLRKLRNKIEQKADVKQRSDDYRSWQRQFSSKKNAVMLGKTISDYEAEMRAKSVNEFGESSTMYQSEEERIDNEIRGFNDSMRKHHQTKSGTELTNVLESLNKLAELEKRITNLESDNKYDQMVQSEKVPANARVSVEFQKKRVPLGQNGPVGVVYAAKKVDKTVKARQKYNGSNIGGSFLTEFEDSGGYDGGNENFDPETQELLGEMSAQQQRRERDRALALASDGKKALRNRLQGKKIKVKEAAIGAKRHNDAMAELIKRRDEQTKFKPSRRVPKLGDEPVTEKPKKGAASGKKTKNKHLQEFEDAKSRFAKKRGLASRNTGGATITAASRTAPAGMMRSDAKAGLTRRNQNPSKPGALPSLSIGNPNIVAEGLSAGGAYRAIRQLRGTSH